MPINGIVHNRTQQVIAYTKGLTFQSFKVFQVLFGLCGFSWFFRPLLGDSLAKSYFLPS